MADCFQVFDRSLGHYDSVPDRELSFLVHCAPNLCVQPVAVARVDPLEHYIAARKTLRRVKSPDAVSLLRRIENCRPVVYHCTGVISLCASAKWASLRRSKSSARLRSVTSCCVATTSTSSPLAEKIGRPIDSRCLTVPSGSTILYSIGSFSSRALRAQPLRSAGLGRPGESVATRLRGSEHPAPDQTPRCDKSLPTNREFSSRCRPTTPLWLSLCASAR